MKRLILDEGVPRQVAQHLPGHKVETVPALGWASVKNGKLLDLIEKSGFDAFISNDKRLQFDQNLSRRPFAVLLLSTNHWETIKPNVGNVAAALESAKPGRIMKVDVGFFVPRKLRKPEWR